MEHPFTSDSVQHRLARQVLSSLLCLVIGGAISLPFVAAALVHGYFLSLALGLGLAVAVAWKLYLSSEQRRAGRVLTKRGEESNYPARLEWIRGRRRNKDNVILLASMVQASMYSLILAVAMFAVGKLALFVTQGDAALVPLVATGFPLLALPVIAYSVYGYARPKMK